MSLEPGDRGVVLEQVTNHQDPVRVLGGGDRTFGICRGGREWLLHEAVLAGVRHRDRELRVRGHWCGEHDRVELLVGQQVGRVGGGARGREGALELRARALVGVASRWMKRKATQCNISPCTASTIPAPRRPGRSLRWFLRAQ